MYSVEAEKLRKELLDINVQILMIEKNHHLEGKEKEEALIRLDELKELRDELHLKLKYQMYNDVADQKGGERIRL